MTLQERITAYLTGGGLFNPELANHDAVRDLLIDCRDALDAQEARIKRLEEAIKIAADDISEVRCALLNRIRSERAFEKYCRVAEAAERRAREALNENR